MIRTDSYSIIIWWRKVTFFASHVLAMYVVPDRLYTAWMHFLMRRLSPVRREEMERRADYYLCLRPESQPDTNPVTDVGTFRGSFGKAGVSSTYFLDLNQAVRCFDNSLRFRYMFGDINYELPSPTLVKSRPVKDGCTNSVLCRLNKVRHFFFVNDSLDYREKKDMLVFRNLVKHRPNRTRFLELYHNHPLCDAGQIDADAPHPEFVRPRMSIGRQLEYKFVACLEGYDVATNLKWVMSSNSIAVMPRPKMETWFMEGTLKPNYHYIEIRDDYADLEERLTYYIAHPDEAEEIIKHAHEYVARFRNSSFERCVQYRVLQRYFEETAL